MYNTKIAFHLYGEQGFLQGELTIDQSNRSLDEAAAALEIISKDTNYVTAALISMERLPNVIGIAGDQFLQDLEEMIYGSAPGYDNSRSCKPEIIDDIDTVSYVADIECSEATFTFITNSEGFCEFMIEDISLPTLAYLPGLQGKALIELRDSFEEMIECSDNDSLRIETDIIVLHKAFNNMLNMNTLFPGRVSVHVDPKAE